MREKGECAQLGRIKVNFWFGAPQRKKLYFAALLNWTLTLPGSSFGDQLLSRQPPALLLFAVNVDDDAVHSSVAFSCLRTQLALRCNSKASDYVFL